MCDDWALLDFSMLNDTTKLPEVSCVYFLMNDNELVYIGQTKNLRSRIGSHKSNWNCDLFVGDKPISEDSFNSVYYLVADYKPERKFYEDMFREDYWPKLNGFDWERDYYMPKILKEDKTKYLESKGIDPDEYLKEHKRL